MISRILAEILVLMFNIVNIGCINRVVLLSVLAIPLQSGRTKSDCNCIDNMKWDGTHYGS